MVVAQQWVEVKPQTPQKDADPATSPREQGENPAANQTGTEAAASATNQSDGVKWTEVTSDQQAILTKFHSAAVGCKQLGQ